MLKTRERIITVQDLVQDVDSAISNAQREPLVVTESGRPTAYLISVELFDALVAQLEALEEAELVTSIAVGEEQFAQGVYKTAAEARVIAAGVWHDQESDV